jgi:hypothetical protein
MAIVLPRSTILRADRICRGCGCTDMHACPGGCSWVLLDVEAATGFCSECAEDIEWDSRIMIEWNRDTAAKAAP